MFAMFNIDLSINFIKGLDPNQSRPIAIRYQKYTIDF